MIVFVSDILTVSTIAHRIVDERVGDHSLRGAPGGEMNMSTLASRAVGLWSWLVVAAAVLATMDCAGTEMAPSSPAYALTLNGQLTTADGIVVEGASVKVSLIHLIANSPRDTAGTCTGVFVTLPLNRVSDTHGRFTANLLDLSTGDSLCTALDVVPPTNAALSPRVFSLRLNPFRVDPTHGARPRDTLAVLLTLTP